jgi:formate dehydrogenase (NADP+) beta subunit
VPRAHRRARLRAGDCRGPRFEDAYLIARGPNPFASICGRICGAPCEAACRRGKVPRVDDDGRFVASDRPIAIRALKRFVCEQFGPEARPPADVLDASCRELRPAGRGERRGDGGAASLDARWPARPLADGESGRDHRRRPGRALGRARPGAARVSPVVFETEPVPAGMLAVGVPAYRLPREVIEREVDVIRALGVRSAAASRWDATSRSRLRRDFSGGDHRGGREVVARDRPARRAGPGVYGGVDLLRAVRSARPRRSAERRRDRRRQRGLRRRAHGRAPDRLRRGAHGRAPARHRERETGRRSKASRRCPPTRSRSSKATKKASSG